MVHAATNGVAISAQGVVKQFGKRVVLQGIDLDVLPGEFVAVVGRSGCGKSTLLRLLAGLEPLTGGDLRVGADLPKAGSSAIRMMFQDARLLPWKRTLENVALGLPASRREDAEEALIEVGLGERARDWPAVLSGGQRQRVALARALVTQPQLLLLDEPLGALDALTRIEMQSLIERIWHEHGFTAMLVTHDVAEAVALADRILVIVDGQIQLDLAVDLPRPRPRGSAQFGAIEEAVLAHVLQQQPAAPVSEIHALAAFDARSVRSA